MKGTGTKSINQRKYENDRQKMSLRSMYFNRFLLIRYTSALFIFINLYGCILLGLSGSAGIVIPAILLILGFIVMWEQMKLFSTPKNTASKTKYFYRIQLVGCILVLASIFTPFYSVFFTFLKASIQIKIAVAFFTVILALISAGVLYRLKKIENLEDRQYQRIIAYQKAIKS
ncbi:MULTISPECIES: hypothetical protein [unclassified Enterococcus]|uniref:hypothetical protein n=1 Tax=unclassified Enterococcus TaxID=2608891 RepID=UPI001553350F|nr:MULTISPECIES: hypothetical protein [unclassified Enterococcus]MBS7576594.1 hypothetical protein [Enterococcus sp. MMGLQ5-2]MBS7583919.1 hypothetical protein [Enterococcus sp. MMGLQ5-1]NPD11780.1 hypothetical protein [Enterococcus sp. MMGLQ5-1]NPD36431.1 hypothetical protein [Enterococcus sp. MMGLQ5-2]